MALMATSFTDSSGSMTFEAESMTAVAAHKSEISRATAVGSLDAGSHIKFDSY